MFPRMLSGTLAVLAALSIAACGVPSANPNPTTIAAPSPTATVAAPTNSPPTSTPVLTPIIGFAPQAGPAGTRISLFGTGYAAGTRIVIRLGTPDPIGEVLAVGEVAADGRWQTELVFPENLPSGEPIPADREIRLVAMDAENRALASAPFQFYPPNPDPRPDLNPERVVSELLAAYQRGESVAPWLGGQPLEAVNGGQSIDDALGLYSNLELRDYTLSMLPIGHGDGAFVEALLVYPGFAEQRIFGLTFGANQMQVTSLSPRGGRPGPDFPGPDFRNHYDADMTQDGAIDSLLYRPAAIVPQASFNDATYDQSAVVAEEFFIVSSGGQVWLRGDDLGILSHNGLIRSFTTSAERPAAYLIGLDPASGVFMSVIPLKADGSQHSPVLSINWVGGKSAFDLIGQ